MDKSKLRQFGHDQARELNATPPKAFSKPKPTFVSEPESVGEAERVVEGHVEEELPPDQPVDGALPPEQQLQGEAAKGLAGGEHLAAVGQRHGHTWVTKQGDTSAYF